MNIRWNLKTIFLISFLLIAILIVFYDRRAPGNEKMHLIAVLEYKISAFFGSKIPTPQFNVFIELSRESLLVNKPVPAKDVKPQTRFKVGEEIFFRPVLINLTPKPVTILQEAGGFSVDIQDEWGRSIRMRVRTKEGYIHEYPFPELLRGGYYFTLRPGEHSALWIPKSWGGIVSILWWRGGIGWDPAKYPVGEGDFPLIFDQPGRYQITVYAFFKPYDMTSFKPKPLTLEEWHIHAIPVWIQVDP